LSPGKINAEANGGDLQNTVFLGYQILSFREINQSSRSSKSTSLPIILDIHPRGHHELVSSVKTASRRKILNFVSKVNLSLFILFNS
jgi:hypothetical protein